MLALLATVGVPRIFGADRRQPQQGPEIPSRAIAPHPPGEWLSCLADGPYFDLGA
jgi:hypothetical protein